MKRLSHIGSDGKVQMVDVSAKPQSVRIAIATGKIKIKRATAAAISRNKIAKGNVLATAQVAGIQAAKRTPDITDGCSFFKDHSTNDDNGDKYLNMDIRLVIEDKEGTSSSPTVHNVRVYVNGRCGY